MVDFPFFIIVSKLPAEVRCVSSSKLVLLMFLLILDRVVVFCRLLVFVLRLKISSVFSMIEVSSLSFYSSVEELSLVLTVFCTRFSFIVITSQSISGSYGKVPFSFSFYQSLDVSYPLKQ